MVLVRCVLGDIAVGQLGQGYRRQGRQQHVIASNRCGGLCSGEARIFEKIAFPRFWTYDTAPITMEDGPAVKEKTAPVDKVELRAILGDAVAEAQQNDPKKLPAGIAEREKAGGGKPDAGAL